MKYQQLPTISDGAQSADSAPNDGNKIASLSKTRSTAAAASASITNASQAPLPSASTATTKTAVTASDVAANALQKPSSDVRDSPNSKQEQNNGNTANDQQQPKAHAKDNNGIAASSGGGSSSVNATMRNALRESCGETRDHIDAEKKCVGSSGSEFAGETSIRYAD